MLYGNEFHYNDVNLNLNYAASDLSQRKKNENYCTAAAREIIAWSKIAIEQMPHVLRDKEKKPMVENMPVRYVFAYLSSKNCFIPLVRLENSRLLSR